MQKLDGIFQPASCKDVILDTDVNNELDDYYAIAYLFGNKDRFHIKGITIAPFAPIYNKKVKDVQEGLEASLRDTWDLLHLMGEDGFKDVYVGSPRFLKNEQTPVESDAADFIIECSKTYTEDNRLYIIAIGAITNVASALLKDPTLKDRIAIVWLGGNAEFVPYNHEFNLIQDVPAARVVMGTDVPFMQVPCQGVVSAFTTGKCEMDHFMKGKNPVCDYLYEKTISTAAEFTKIPTWSRVIWDVVAVAALLNDDGRYMHIAEKKRQLPMPETGLYEKDPLPLTMLCVEQVHRDGLMYDLFCTLYKYADR